MTAFDKRFKWLADDPNFGEIRNAIKRGYRSYPEGRHIIIYREISLDIEVLAILHQKM